MSGDIKIHITGPNFADGNCANIIFPDLFYPDSLQQEKDSLEMIEGICGPCVRQSQCLEFALEHNEREGYWGGKSPAQRELIQRNRNYAEKVIRRSQEVQRLIEAGLPLEDACGEVGILPQSFKRYQLRNQIKASHTNNHEQESA